MVAGAAGGHSLTCPGPADTCVHVPCEPQKTPSSWGLPQSRKEQARLGLPLLPALRQGGMVWSDSLGELLQQMEGFEGVSSLGTLLRQGQRVLAEGTGSRRGTGEAGAPVLQLLPFNAQRPGPEGRQLGRGILSFPSLLLLLLHRQAVGKPREAALRPGKGRGKALMSLKQLSSQRQVRSTKPALLELEGGDSWRTSGTRTGWHQPQGEAAEQQQVECRFVKPRPAEAHGMVSALGWLGEHWVLQQNHLPRLYAPAPTAASDGEGWRNTSCFCFSKCQPERSAAAREAAAERSKADLCHGLTLLQKPQGPQGSQLRLPATGTAFPSRAGMDISPHWRCFGGGNRNVYEQTGSPHSPVLSSPEPSAR